MAGYRDVYEKAQSDVAAFWMQAAWGHRLAQGTDPGAGFIAAALSSLVPRW
jgi:hypothetical protein